MRRLILALALCLRVWGADHYVDCAVAGPGSGTLGDPWKTLASLNGHTMAADDFAYLKRGCTWAEQSTPGQSGTDGHPITYSAYGTGALPVITGGTRALYVNGKSYLVYRDLEFHHVAYFLGGASNVVLDRVIARQGTARGFDVTSGSITIYNSLILGFQSHGIALASGTTVVLKNSIVVGNGAGTDWLAAGGYGIQANSGSTFQYGNNLISGNGRTLSANIYGTGTKTDLGGNQIEVTPNFNGWPIGTAYFALATDGDGASTVDVNGAHLLSILPSDVKFTLYLTWLASLVNLPTIAGFTGQGVELGAHGRTHTDLTKTTAFGITSTNGSATIAVNATGKTLTLHCTTSPQCDTDIVLDWNATEKTITDLKTAVSGKGWTVNTTSGVQDAVYLKILADTSGAQAAPYTANIDMTAYYTNEVLDAMQWIADNLNYTPVTYAYPVGSNDAGVQEFCRAHDTVVKGARGVSGGSMGLSKVAIQQLVGFSLATNVLSGITTEADTRAAARHYYVLGRGIGGAVIFFYHFTDVTDSQLLWFIDELRVQGATFSTVRQIVEAVRAGHSTADSGATWTYSYADASDPRFRKCSSDVVRYLGCNLGTNLGAPYNVGLDPRNPSDVQSLDNTWFGWDIGPYVRIKRKVVGN